MSKATEQNDKLKRAIIISVALHIILIALLIWSSFDEHLMPLPAAAADRRLMPSWSIRGGGK